MDLFFYLLCFCFFVSFSFLFFPSSRDVARLYYNHSLTWKEKRNKTIRVPYRLIFLMARVSRYMHKYPPSFPPRGGFWLWFNHNYVYRERDYYEQSLLSSSSSILLSPFGVCVCCSGCLFILFFFFFPRGFVHNRRMPCRTRAWLFYISASPPLFLLCVSTKHKRQQQQHRHQREQKAVRPVSYITARDYIQE